MSFEPMVMCYGNTRSNMLTAAVKTHLDHMGISGIDVQTGGLARVVEGIYSRAGTTDVGLPEGVIANGNEVDPDYGRNLANARRLVATPERLARADTVLVADANLATAIRETIPGPKLRSILSYAPHKAPIWKYDLDDASPRGALEVVNAKAEGMSEEDIAQAIESGQFQYHAPLGGDYKIGSHEAEQTEVEQIYNLGAILAVRFATTSASISSAILDLH